MASARAIGGLLDEPPADPLDLAAAPVEGLVEIAERLGQRLARGPGGLRLPGLDRPELLDRLPQGGDHRLGLLDQPPPALGLELQLVPQRRELLDEVDQAELGPVAAVVLAGPCTAWGPSGSRARGLGPGLPQPSAEPVEDFLDVLQSAGRSW